MSKPKIESIEIEEITLEQLCKEATQYHFEEYWSAYYDYIYYVEDGKIYRKIIKYKANTI